MPHSPSAHSPRGSRLRGWGAQPFRDMIEGMRMDLVKSRYRTFDELYGYCYKVAGTVALMTTPVMGIDPAYPVRRRAATWQP